MKTAFIEDINIGDDFQSFFMVKSIAVRIGGNKKPFLDLLLGDKTGELPGKQWDISDADIEAYKDIAEGDLIKARGSVTEWNGSRQLRVGKLRKSQPADNLLIMDYIKAAPEPAEAMYAFVREQAALIKDADYQALCLALLERNKEKLLYYPAAAKNHHAELGGLLYHVKRMLLSALALCDVYRGLNRDMVVTGVIIHDIEKLNEIDADKFGIASGYSFEGQLLGHLVQGVKLIDRLGGELGLPEEKRILLEHMILSHHYEPEYGSPRKPLFPEAEILHYLDVLDAKLYDMEEALRQTKPGGFSEKVWTLDNRKLYKPIGG